MMLMMNELNCQFQSNKQCYLLINKENHGCIDVSLQRADRAESITPGF